MVTTFVFGITIGSFLNAVIYRLPNGLSLLEPRHSICPNCKNTLTAIDLVPLFSFLFLGQKCRQCKQPISWRYFWVELLTGLMFVSLYLRFPNNPATCVALLLCVACLVPIYFIDLATFTIPISLNLLLFLIALGRDAWGIAQHEAGHGLLWGWLPRSLAGAVLGVLIFGAVRVAGWLWKRQEAMGLGDVLLARGMGALLVSVTPVGWYWWALFPAWVMLSCFSGIVVGPALIIARQRRAAKEAQDVSLSAEAEVISDEEETRTLLHELGDIVWVLCIVDFREWVLSYRKTPASDGAMPPFEEEPFVPAPSAIPFGPFLVIGFLATVFVGAWLTAAYLAYALPKRQ